MNNNVGVLDKLSLLPDQRNGKTFAIDMPVIGIALNTHVISIPVATPFFIQGSPNITIKAVNLVNLGDITPKCNIYGVINNGGFEIRGSDLTLTSGISYTGKVSVRFDF